MRFFIVNENAKSEIPGAVDVFTDLEALLSYYEPWYAKESHVILDEDAQAFKLIAPNDKLALESVGLRKPELLTACIRWHMQHLNPKKVPMIAEYQPRLSEMNAENLLLLMRKYVEWMTSQDWSRHRPG